MLLLSLGVCSRWPESVPVIIFIVGVELVIICFANHDIALAAPIASSQRARG